MQSGSNGVLRVAETFLSIQGESSYAGYPCWFIRLAGCNLACRYCDTPQARSGGESVGIEVLVDAAAASGAPLVEVTGGEPLMQASTSELLARLQAVCDATVLVETNGSLDLSVVPAEVIAIVDVKCPGSGAGDSFALDNVTRLKPHDEVKFVLSDRADYEWARAFLATHRLPARCAAVLFSAAEPSLPVTQLADWMLEDRVAARCQRQWHKRLGLR